MTGGALSGAGAAAAVLPDPAQEIRLVQLGALRGANYWSTRPVTRMDLVVGAYEDISSADVPGVTERLLAVLPGLAEHRCSVGERGGFVTRLRRGTYAPHVVEHVALELQVAIGHDVGYGRARGGDAPGEYTLVVEHRHEAVGLRAVGLALGLVQQAFAGTLESAEHALAELRALAEMPDVPPVTQHVRCAVTGGAHRAETRAELARLGLGAESLVADVAPAYILQQGLPYARSDVAVVLDMAPVDVPARYREPEHATRLMGVMADAARGGVLVAPAQAWALQDRARDAGCRVAIFAVDRGIRREDKHVACAVAWSEGGRVVVERAGEPRDVGPLRPGAPALAQVAALLTVAVLGAEREAGDAGA